MVSAPLKVKVALEYSKGCPKENLLAPSVTISGVFVGVGLLVAGLDGVGLAVVSVDGAPPQLGINKAKHPRIARKAKDLTIFDSFCRNKARF